MRGLLLITCLLLGITSLSLAQDETQTPYEIALARILEAEETGATRLDLHIMQLTNLPPEIGNLSNLRTLNLHENQLSSLPPEIGKLSNLESLYLGKNQLSSLPSEIGKLSNLQDLQCGITN